VPDVLEYAHKLGILHREIKPSNLLLDTRGTVWVTDFGLAKATDQPNLTHNGDILGTLRYLPPEPFEGQSDVRVEVYSLGLTLYELLAFRPAFGEKERGRLLDQVMTFVIPPRGHKPLAVRRLSSPNARRSGPPKRQVENRRFGTIPIDHSSDMRNFKRDRDMRQERPKTGQV
jgi:serine/threonine protein kinase